MMPSSVEQKLSRSLRAVLADLPDGAGIPESGANFEQFRSFLWSLESFIPPVLQTLHPEWGQESLDGFIRLVARKVMAREVEYFGLCILIADQTLTPVHLCLQIAPSADAVSWLECKLGERGEEGMLRTPYRFRDKCLAALEGMEDRIDWDYKVTFGDRRPLADNR
jgi:hypothetical protein